MANKVLVEYDNDSYIEFHRINVSALHCEWIHRQLECQSV